ncbi:Glycoside hydrolase family 3 protein [Mycena indigotica]|uniref:xylan 1,4-beta-xylosidase n=1 Tax=Mycena indigotica TaxID=2126181 RepID=A0A8H6VVH8_9AGAR|nr:Glycoside hydrolase family 3 protein [Mycena indigotica]KAF7289794.1 Glycoside hydrolase family 3 protein [Mycena indigotica]
MYSLAAQLHKQVKNQVKIKEVRRCSRDSLSNRDFFLQTFIVSNNLTSPTQTSVVLNSTHLGSRFRTLVTPAGRCGAPVRGRSSSCSAQAGTVEALLDELLHHLAGSELVSANSTVDLPRLRSKKDAFLNDVVSAFSDSIQRPMNIAQHGNVATNKDKFIADLVNEMTVSELAIQMHLMFADNIIGINSDNAGYDTAMEVDPTASVGVIHDWYPTNSTQFNSIQQLNLEKSRLKIPFLAFGECVHGVGSFRQSMFPQAIGLSASFDPSLVYDVGRAIGTEARAIGVHACLAPVLDLGKEPRWGRVQEAWGEDYVHTALMGIQFARGLSKNGSWADPDAVVPVMKHFAAYGSPKSGLNAAPHMGRGLREVMQEMLVPFKAVVDLGFARGVMMSYNELDEIPAHVHPVLYGALAEWGFDGFTLADDTGMEQLFTSHGVASSPADAIAQWFNAGGMVNFYDFPIDVWVNSTIDLVANGTVKKATLKDHVTKILGVKYDLGLFDNPYLSDTINVQSLTTEHAPLTLDAARKSIVLLENRNSILPLDPKSQNLRTMALIGPFGDMLNYGDYSGQWGMYPTNHSSTIRQAMKAHLETHYPSTQLVSSWGADTWTYHGQYNIPNYLLSFQGALGMRGTYFADTNFSEPVFTLQETPNRDWGLYPPVGLPSNNFSVIWEGELEVPVDGAPVDGWLGVAAAANCSARLFVDGVLVAEKVLSPNNTIIGNIQVGVDNAQPPPGGVEFLFQAGAKHQLRLEFQAFNTVIKRANFGSLNAEVELFWNLVDRRDAVKRAVDLAKKADVVVLAVGANWNSDGESGDRATLGLSPNQTVLADAIYDLGKPVILVLQGGRPFAIPEHYTNSAAVVNAFFPGQSGGQAISDVLFGVYNPGARVPLSVPFDVGTLPVYYNYKSTAHANNYTDENAGSYPIYSFGYGLSYTTFESSDFNTRGQKTFSLGSNITFSTRITNTGNVAGSYVPQVYLLRAGRVSTITVAVKQLVAFSRVYLDAGESAVVDMDLEVDRFLQVYSNQCDLDLYLRH